MLSEIRFLGSRIRVWSTNIENVDKIVIFLHGSGITAFGMEKWLRSFVLVPPANIAVLLPSAPMLRYHLEGGQRQSVWHQRKDLSIDSAYEDTSGIDRISDGLGEMINQIEVAGFKNTVVGGFSMGGHTAIHSVFRNGINAKGCFALSSYLINQSAVYKSIETKDSSDQVPLYLAHGDSDRIVPMEWAKILHNKFEMNNVETSLVLYKDLDHEISSHVIQDLFSWILHSR